MPREPYDDGYSDRDDRRYPARRDERYDDDYDDYDDYDRRPRRRYRGAPHRGGLILGLGIASFFVCGLIGLAPWIMGNNDLNEIRAGRMDREGEGLTNAGRICGIIAFFLTIAALIFYAVLVLFILSVEPRHNRF